MFQPPVDYKPPVDNYPEEWLEYDLRTENKANNMSLKGITTMVKGESQTVYFQEDSENKDVNYISSDEGTLEDKTKHE